MSDILNNLPFDPIYLLIGSCGLSLVLLVAFIVCIIKMNKLYRRYDLFMRGKDAETLEDTLIGIIEELADLNAKDRMTKDMMKRLNKQVKDSYQKFGLVKYNAFKGMGGNLSFVLAMLDGNNSGYILDAVHSREGCYMYLKEVEEGATEVLLGSEEQEALEQALGYVQRPTLSERLDQNQKTARRNRAKAEPADAKEDLDRPSAERLENVKKIRRRSDMYEDLDDVEESGIEKESVGYLDDFYESGDHDFVFDERI